MRTVCRHISGIGKASKHMAGHDGAFGCRMVGTFNARMDRAPAWTSPDRDFRGKHYWLVVLTSGAIRRYAWALRWDGSDQPPRVAEFLTKRPLEPEFKAGEFLVEFPRPWTADEIKAWASDRYFFQTFPWSKHVAKSDSAKAWRAINCIDWSGLGVWDFGCHMGYYALQASALGAQCVGHDVAEGIIRNARLVNDHIERQDVEFQTSEPAGGFDVILYLSVHHQRDPRYEWLADELTRLKQRARKHLFVELHTRREPSTPAVDPKFTLEQLDQIVGGQTLLTYQHRLRGIRRIWRVDL